MPTSKSASEDSSASTVERVRSVDSDITQGFWKVFQNASRKLDSLGVETRGIERIEAYERSTNKTKQLISVIGLWLSASGGLSSMSSFFLGPLLFGLGLRRWLVLGFCSDGGL